jgi:DNA primase
MPGIESPPRLQGGSTDSSSLFRANMKGTFIMPGVDFRELRASIPIAEILHLIGYVPVHQRDDQVRGPCPIHRSRSRTSRVFSVNLRTNAYRCFQCGSTGNQLGLYAAVTQKQLFEAAVELCAKLNRPTPWIYRW